MCWDEEVYGGEGGARKRRMLGAVFLRWVHWVKVFCTCVK